MDIHFQLTKEIDALKLKVRTDVELKELSVKQDRTVHMLENRLDVATKRFNLAIAQNAKLRAEIDDLLKDRGQFTMLWNKIINQLNTGKQIINDLIEQSTIAFNQRDDDLNKIQALRERFARNLVEHFIPNIPVK